MLPRCLCKVAVVRTGMRVAPRRLLSVSTPRLANRAPTFTTPEPAAVLDDYDPSLPLPPTNLPIEDYASPLAHAYDVFAKLFRYAVFGSVSIVTVGVVGLVGMHIWVENVELGLPAVEEDAQSWREEIEGWSGGHLGGGTDPRLGTTVRSAIRGAWIAQTWGTGAVGSPVSSSPFSVNSGGAMIGVEKMIDAAEVGDAGWQLAEGYLIYALQAAESRGISLCAPSVGDTLDRTAVELEQRLAGLRELMGGSGKLEAAREGLERVYYALSASTNPSAWEQRERIRTTKKLGEISARIAEMYPVGSDERRFEIRKAEGWLRGGLMPVLGVTHAVITGKPSKKESSRFWMRSSAPPTQLRPETRALVDTLARHSSSPSPAFDPPTSRCILNSLVSLETYLARDRDLVAAEAVQTAALALARSLARPSPDLVRTDKLLENTPDKSAALYQLYLTVRSAIFSTHLAEVSLALKQPVPDALQLIQSAIIDSQAVCAAVRGSALDIPPSALSSSKPSLERRRLGKAARDILRDAALAGSLAANLGGFVHERGCGPNAKRGAKGLDWCSETAAEEFYAVALTISQQSRGAVGPKGLALSSDGFRRTKAEVELASKVQR